MYGDEKDKRRRKHSQNTATKPNDQLPESNTGKEAAVIDQQVWQRKNNNKRNKRKKNNNTQVLNARVSGTKDDHGIFIEASTTELGDIFQDSTSELEEITQHTADIEVGEIVDAVNSPTQTHGTLGPVENARTSIVAVHIGDEVIVSESLKDQVGGTLYEGEHTSCRIRSTDDSHYLQLVVAAVNDPIASFKSPKNTFRVLNEADSLLTSTYWVGMAEEAEETERAEKEGTWRTQKKKATKSKWME
ncbi:hypothetical protein IFM89_029547 [Coptis chinensis]|uniref:Uncharacterized protein n=1 Tax=Coptis chinensis TaxID=261450 RepID=A0A835LJT4_9MAGN|nr:hypothetical protein IFM89_029547 [Coptis chinensis]